MDPHFDGVIFQTHAAELVKRLRYAFPRFCVLDVRDGGGYAAAHIPTARRVAAAALAAGLPDGTDAATEFIVVGSGPGDAAVRRASLALREHGARRVVEFSGGMAEWADYAFATEREANEASAA
jgi:rhodanese-related sulfurtransferase